MRFEILEQAGSVRWIIQTDVYAPLVETRNFKFVCALMVILSLGGV